MTSGAAASMRVVHHRVDAFTHAFRVELSDAFKAELEARSEIARNHGRAAFEWRGVVNKRDGAAPKSRRLFHDVMIGLPPWAIPSDVARVGRNGWELEKRPADARPVNAEPFFVGELRYSRARKVYDITNDPYFRMHVDVWAPGKVVTKNDDGEPVEEAGWTIEIVWYAQTLADWGLEKCLREGRALAWTVGEVKQERVRRLDLAVDIMGREIRPDDVDHVVKRPRAKMTVASDATEIEEMGRAKGRPKKLGEMAGATAHLTGTRKVCGISVGKNTMLRIYDKRLELSYAEELKRRAEEERWSLGGWDGAAPITRVEYQIRGAALDELGLRDPECCLEAEEIRVPTGKRCVRERAKIVGQLPAVTEDGEVLRLPDRLPWIWATMLQWARLVVPDSSERVKKRLKDDPLWALLRDVDWGEMHVEPMKRYRARAVASEAQALGVALSQAAKAGTLAKMNEDKSAYNERGAESELRDRVQGLMDQQRERVLEWLLARGDGGAVNAIVHLAIRNNAALARRYEWPGLAGRGLRTNIQRRPRASPLDAVMHAAE